DTLSAAHHARAAPCPGEHGGRGASALFRGDRWRDGQPRPDPCGSGGANHHCPTTDLAAASPPLWAFSQAPAGADSPTDSARSPLSRGAEPRGPRSESPPDRPGLWRVTAYRPSLAPDGNPAARSAGLPRSRENRRVYPLPPDPAGRGLYESVAPMARDSGARLNG